MSAYSVVLSNLASLPCIVYYQYHRKFFYSFQILFNSLFSFLHHLNGTGLYIIQDEGVFDFLDGLYSYLSIYVFSIYFFLTNHYELRTELYVVQTMLMAMVYLKMGAAIVLPVTVFAIFFVTGMYYRRMHAIMLRNPWFYVMTVMCITDIGCFFTGLQYEYDWFHSAHHLLAFTLPIIVDKCLPPTNSPYVAPMELPMSAVPSDSGLRVRIASP